MKKLFNTSLIVFCYFLISPIYAFAQSDRDIDCNGVCEAYGLSSTQCWQYIHSWHSARSMCANYFYSNEYDLTENGAGTCQRNYGNNTWGRFECGTTHCDVTGVMNCGRGPQSYSASCGSVHSVPTVTSRETDVRCQGGSSEAHIYCGSDGNIVIGQWIY